MSTDASRNRQSWRERTQSRGQARLSRDLGRFGNAIALITLIGLLLYFLFPPFLAPETHLVLLGSDNVETFNTPPIPYVANDNEAVRSVAHLKLHDRSDDWDSKQQAVGWIDAFAGDAPDSSDTLIVYLTAHGVVSGGEPYLLCGNFDLRSPGPGRVSLSTFLRQVSETQAGTKLVVLNTGTIQHDPRLGTIGNDFPRLLEEAVGRANDPSLWVLASHAELQTSHVSRAAERSVFGMFVTAGLSGHADLNQDFEITLSELASFTSANVASWVQQSSDRADIQTPTLIWGGAASATPRDARLVTLYDRKRQPELTVAELLNLERGVTDAPADDPGRLALGPMRRSHADSPAPDPAAPAADAEKGEGGLKAPADEKGEGGIKEPEEATPGGKPEDPSAPVKRLLAEAWKLRDTTLHAPTADPLVDPLQNVPHLWREFQAELLGIERQLRDNSEQDVDALEDILDGMLPKPDPAKPDVKPQWTLLTPSTGGKPDSLVDADGVHSLALAQLIAEVNQERFPIDLDGLSSALKATTEMPLEAWLKKEWKEDYGDYCDLAFIKQLSETPNVPWSLVQVASQVSLTGERVAALDLAIPGWVRDSVRSGDQYRFFAEQLLFDQIGEDWEDRSEALLRRANQHYAEAESDVKIVQQLRRLADVLIDRLPAYLKFRQAAGPADRRGVTETIDKMLDDLAEVSRLMQQADSGTLTDLAALRDELLKSEGRMQQLAGDGYAAQLVGRAALQGDAHRIDLLLDSPSLSAGLRSRLIALVAGVDRNLATGYRLAELDRVATPAELLQMRTRPSRDQWQFLIEQSRLEKKYVALFDAVGDGDPLTQGVTEAFGNLQQSWSTLENDSSDTLWTAHHDFSDALASFYQSVADATLGSGGSRDDRVLRMLDPRDAWQFRTIDVQSLSESARTRTTLAWQAQRLVDASIYRDGPAAAALARVSREYQMLSLGAEFSGPRAGLTVESPLLGSLQYDALGRSQIRLINDSQDDVTVMLSVDHADDMIELSTDEPTSRKRSDFGTLKIGPVTVASDDQAVVPLELRRREVACEDSVVTVDVYQTSGQDLAESTIIARNRLDLSLPVSEVFVQRGKTKSQSEYDGLTLYPFANRVTKFKLGAVNLASTAKQVAMSCYPLEVPFEEVMEDPAIYLAGRKPLAEFKVQPGADRKPAFPGTAPPAEAKPETPAAPPAPAPEADKPEGDKKPKTTPLPNGLLVVLRDLESGKTTYRPIEFAVQRPRRFLRPQVGFDANRNRINVSVYARNINTLPEGVPVRVSCGIAGSPAGSLEGNLQGVITRTKNRAGMFINMPTPPPQFARVQVNVDGYPRAFLFDVQCGKHAGDIPELTNLIEARMTASAEEGYVAAADSIPVMLEVNTPVGSFESGEDLLEVGVDFEGTGIPDPGSIIRFNTDRSVSMGFVKAMPNGTLELYAEVSDFEVDLPTARLENIAINVAGEMLLRGERLSIPTIPLFIDTASPIVGPVKRNNFAGYVPAGAKLDLTAWAWDGGSGLKRVEAVFDAEGSGEFPAEGKFTQGVWMSGREWSLLVDVPADPGETTLLVRGIDRVGNESDPVAVTLQVVSAEEAGALVKQQTVELAGVVKFLDNNVPEAELKLTAVAADPAAPPDETAGTAARSRENGGFTFSGVPPGTYRLATRGVVRNRPRFAEQEIVVTPGKKRVVRVDVSLK